MNKNGKRIGIGIGILAVLVIVTVIISNGFKEKKQEVEIINSEYTYLQSEYEEKYNVSTDKIQVRKNGMYKFKWDVFLSEGNCTLNVTDSKGKVVWSKVIESGSVFDETVELQDITEGECEISIKIDEKAEGSVKFLVTETI